MGAVIRLTLPKPPSLNNLFLNIPGRGRVPSPGYLAWRAKAEERLWTTRVKPIAGPVEIAIQIEDNRRQDLDNSAKGLLDFLVHHGLIEDDGPKIVRKITLEFAEVAGAVIEVRSCAKAE